MDGGTIEEGTMTGIVEGTVIETGENMVTGIAENVVTETVVDTKNGIK
jgi:hypothetical protein